MKTFIIIFIAICIFFAIKYEIEAFIWDPMRRGKKSENHTAKILNKKFGIKPIQNILIFSAPEESTEIDMAFATKKGIFVVENKYREGSVSGDIKDDKWFINTTNDCNSMPNPAKQNLGHIKEIKRIAKDIGFHDVKCFNVVIVDCDNPPSITGLDNLSETFVSGPYGIKSNIMKKIANLPDIYTDDEVQKLNDLLKNHIGTKQELISHAVRIMKKYGDTEK